VPGEQFVQVSPLFPVHPALQVQAGTSVLPAGEFEFRGQDVHVLPFAPKYPELH